MFDSGDLAQDLLCRARHHVLHIRAAGTREGDQHIGHRHIDLRFFLARCDQHGKQAKQHRNNRQKRRQRIALEGRGQAAGNAEL